jgi:hypothetical protein
MQFVSDTFTMSGSASLELLEEDNVIINQSLLKLVE